MNFKFLGILAILVVVVYFGFNTAGLVSIRNHDGTFPEYKQDIVWNNLAVNLQSAYFGSVSDDQTNQFCSSNGGASISNSFINSNILTLKSSASHGNANDNCGDSSNYINAKTILPAGKLTVTCTASTSCSYDSCDQQVIALCKIPELNYEGKSNQIKDLGRQYGMMGVPSFTETKTFTITKDTPITFEVDSGFTSSQSSNANAQLEISFTPDKPITSGSQTSVPAGSQQGTTNDVTVGSPSIVDKINSYIQSIVNWVKGLFG